MTWIPCGCDTCQKAAAFRCMEGYRKNLGARLNGLGRGFSQEDIAVQHEINEQFLMVDEFARKPKTEGLNPARGCE